MRKNNEYEHIFFIHIFTFRDCDDDGIDHKRIKKSTLHYSNPWRQQEDGDGGNIVQYKNVRTH